MVVVWGLCRQRDPGAEPLVRRSGGGPPQKLTAFAARKSYFLYFLRCIMKIQRFGFTCYQSEFINYFVWTCVPLLSYTHVCDFLIPKSVT